MKYRKWRESQECFSDDEKNLSKRKKLPIYSPTNWSSLLDRQTSEDPVSSTSEMSVALVGISSSSSSPVSGYDESTSTLAGFRNCDSLNVNFRALEHEALVRIRHPKKFTDLTVDIQRLRVNMAVVNTWNDTWVRLPKEGFVDKKRKLIRRNRRSDLKRAALARRCDTVIEYRYAHTVITHPQITSEICDRDETCVKLNELKMNSEPINDDGELIKKMSTLSCNQNPDWDRKIDELTHGWNVIMNGLLVDQLDGKISNLKIEEVDNNQNPTRLSRNPFG